MPICPRCGKCLSSDQALTYHLNRKYRCGTWKCNKCNEILNTKFQLQMHEMKCLNVNDQVFTPNTDFLLQLYNSLPFVILQTDSRKTVTSASPKCKELLNIDPKDIKDKNIHELFNQDKLLTIFENNNNSIIMIK